MSASEGIAPDQVVSITQATSSPHNDSSANGKRLRRERSYAGRAHTGNVGKKTRKPGSNHDSTITIPQGTPIFLQKTYEMISECNEDLAGWINDGEMFVVKDTDRFAKEVIPKYFDHSKFPSFARQLNFYRFRKIQDKPVRNADIDKSTAKHVKFCNDNFKRDKPELLCNIQRSTKGGNAGNAQEQQRQINELKEQVASYVEVVERLTERMDSMEKIISDLTRQSYQNQYDQGNGVTELARQLSTVSLKPLYNPSEYDPIPIANMSSNPDIPPKSSKPTLPPHPKIKSELPCSDVLPVPSIALNGSLPQKSRLSSDCSLLPRGLSIDPNVFGDRGLSTDLDVFESSFHDRLFTTIMLDEKEVIKNETEKDAQLKTTDY